jgi:hypothetical protein
MQLAGFCNGYFDNVFFEDAYVYRVA